MHKLLNRVICVIDNTNDCVGMVARWIAIVMLAVILIEVGGRYIFGLPPVWGYELSQMLWGTYILFGGIYALRCGAHVSFDQFWKMVSPRKRAILDSVTQLLFFSFCIAIVYRGVPYALESLLANEHATTVWAPPLWPIKMLISIAVFLLMVQGGALYIRNFYTAITGKKLT